MIEAMVPVAAGASATVIMVLDWSPRLASAAAWPQAARLSTAMAALDWIRDFRITTIVTCKGAAFVAASTVVSGRPGIGCRSALILRLRLQRAGGKLLHDLNQQLPAQLCELLLQLRFADAFRHRHLALSQDGACIGPLLEHVDSYAGLGQPQLEGPVQRRGAAILRKQRGMDVDGQPCH